MDRSHYIENLEQYIFDECTNINRNEVRTFLKKIEELYINHLHKIVEDYPGTYALFQLMTISHREVIGKILENERNIKKYFNALECKKIQIDDENINLFHAVSEKEYGTIRFTGISGAERKREQNINEFYVENTFSYYGKEIEKLYNCGLEEIETIRLENFFDFGNKIVLIGGAGLGKSTTLNYLYCNYERMYKAYAVKIKIDLKEYAKEIGEKKKGLLWCITNEFSKRSKYVKLSFDEIQSVLSDYLDNGKCLVILDALDEIPTLAIRNKVRDEIAIFCGLYYLNRFIISTREAGYLRNRFDETFLHIKINQFSDYQIKKYSENWFKLYYNNLENFEEFWKKFEEEVKRARCENIISNPIILILALVIFDIEKNLPTRRIEFYQKCIETFLTERENRKGAYVLEDKTKSILSVNLTLPKIAYYKFEHLKDNVGYKFIYSELENAVYNSIGVTDILNWASAVKQYIEYLIERTELVQEIDENYKVCSYYSREGSTDWIVEPECISEKMKELFERYDLYKKYEIYSMDEIKAKLVQTEENLQRVRSMSIQQMLEDKDDREQLPENVKNNILLMFLLQRGYINENYADYINYFREGSISRSELNFIRTVRSRQGICDFEFVIRHHANVIEKLFDYEFEQVELLNYSLMDYMLQHCADSSQMQKLLGQVTNRTVKSKQFIKDYLSRGKFVAEFVKRIAAISMYIWEDIAEDIELT